MAKGDCFDAAYRYLRELDDEGETGIVLCHGIVTNPSGTFCHAWVEKTTGRKIYAIDVTNGRHLAFTRATYYKTLSVERVVRYDRKQALIQLVRHAHYGPWDPAFDHLAG